MPRLTHADQQRLLGALHELHAETDPIRLRETVVRVARQLVPCEMGSYNEYTPDGAKVIVSTRFPDTAEVVKHFPAFQAYFFEHPGRRYSQETGDDNPYQFTDFVSERKLQQLRLYNEYYRPIGVRHQMAMAFDGGGPLKRALSLNRSHGRFSERDRLVLALLRPHFHLACEHVAIAARLRVAVAALESTVGRTQGMLVVDRNDRVQWLSGPARAWLRTFTGAELGADSALPGDVARWLKNQRRSGQDDERTLAPAARLHLVGQAGRLSLALGAEDDEGNRTVLVTFEQLKGSPAHFQGLTRREDEVLHWLAFGESNPEIARILGVSKHTVYKHVENLFAKLGVETRAAAMLHVLEATQSSGEK